jgi:hypothetical protein
METSADPIVKSPGRDPQRPFRPLPASGDGFPLLAGSLRSPLEVPISLSVAIAQRWPQLARDARECPRSRVPDPQNGRFELG